MNNRFVFKIAAAFACAAFFVSALSAQVNEPELKSVSDTIEFINYVGPHARIDSLSAIKAIGSSSGRIIARSRGAYMTAGDSGKYYVIHAVDPNEKGKFDADILIIGRNATVDHIVNLRRIISAYLSAAYNYSERDADTLAVFITVYNAVYRSNIDYFKSRYKNIVTKNLSERICGLSVRYDEWPGRSQIVIPLYDVNGGLSTVDTSAISDKRVVESMKEDDDRNIESRKQMVDIKERGSGRSKIRTIKKRRPKPTKKSRLRTHSKRKPTNRLSVQSRQKTKLPKRRLEPTKKKPKRSRSARKSQRISRKLSSAMPQMLGRAPSTVCS